MKKILFNFIIFLIYRNWLFMYLRNIYFVIDNYVVDLVKYWGCEDDKI